jgi:hypothetical protein
MGSLPCLYYLEVPSSYSSNARDTMTILSYGDLERNENWDAEKGEVFGGQEKGLAVEHLLFGLVFPTPQIPVSRFSFAQMSTTTQQTSNNCFSFGSSMFGVRNPNTICVVSELLYRRRWLTNSVGSWRKPSSICLFSRSW